MTLGALLVAGGLATRSVAPVRLSLPPPGQVSTQLLRGIPVFVVHDVDGVTAVLDAFSPHVHLDHDFFPLLAWCRSSQMFEDLWFGSRFGANGAYQGGPAPTGMSAYELLEVDDHVVDVGDVQPAPPRPQGPNGPNGVDDCASRTANYAVIFEPGSLEIDPAVLEDLVIHEPVPDAPTGWWFVTPQQVLGEEAVVPSDWPTE